MSSEFCFLLEESAVLRYKDIQEAEVRLSGAERDGASSLAPSDVRDLLLASYFTEASACVSSISLYRLLAGKLRQQVTPGCQLLILM